jgi:hypothetical protein
METARAPSNPLFIIISFNESSAELSLRHLPNCSTVGVHVDLGVIETNSSRLAKLDIPLTTN